ncbi:MAG TPA: ABC transporter permease [Beutenbergiaceae bacterium]|nr:ABC transporter permease [Beutenbergiaceae bacterium]
MSETPTPEADGNRLQEAAHPNLLQQMLRSSWLVTLLAIVGALVISGILIVAADEKTRAASSYFFARPYDMLWYAADAIKRSYVALFQGAVFNYEAKSFTNMIRPLTETMVWATPLLFAGLGLGIGFRAGMFNIGAQGQVLMGAGVAAIIGFKATLPGALLLIAALAGSILIGGIWAGIAGYLKAKTGANEVIVTIMLNWIATWLAAYLLTTQFMREGAAQPITPPVADNAMLPRLLPEPFRLHLGFVLALLAALGVWWLMERSTLGFKFRAVGANPDAARTAGINVNMVYVWVLGVAGILAGLGGASVVLGTNRTFVESSAGSIGFDAITVALLGKSRPLGTVWAALLFGALRAGAPFMQTMAKTPIDIVLVIQAVIVLFIAAPGLVRTIFVLPKTGYTPVKEVVA